MRGRVEDNGEGEGRGMYWRGCGHSRISVKGRLLHTLAYVLSMCLLVFEGVEKRRESSPGMKSSRTPRAPIEKSPWRGEQPTCRGTNNSGVRGVEESLEEKDAFGLGSRFIVCVEEDCGAMLSVMLDYF